MEQHGSKYESLRTYLKLAKISILKHAKYLRNNEDAIAHVVYFAILADKKYNDKIGNKESFRYKNMKFGILNYIRSIKNQNQKIIKNKKYRQISIIDSLIINESMKLFYNSKLLSNKEKKILELRFIENKKIHYIAKQYNVSKQRISKIISSSLKKAQKIYGLS